jgi:hypothetical protein
MDEFLKIENEKSEETTTQKGKKNVSVDKKRVARLKRTFLPYWARITGPESKAENNINVSQ